MLNVIEKLGGTTLKATWVSSGDLASPISSALFDRNETLVGSIAAVSSGNGFFYAVHLLPNTRGWYVNQWIGVIGANTYIDRQLIRCTMPEVD